MKARSGGKTFEIRDERVRGAKFVKAEDVATGLDGTIGVYRGINIAKDLSPAPPKYDSKWEERYATMLDLEQKAGAVVKWWHHPWSMRLPGGAKYTPDFLVQHHGHLEVVDVKGYHRNLREAMLRIKVAAAIYTCYTWRLAKWNGKDFDCIPVEVDPW